MASYDDLVSAVNAAITHVESLEREIKGLRADNEQLRAENQQLKTQVTELESKLTKSQREGKRQAAPFRRRKRKPKSQHKKSGRESGHEPSSRSIPDKIDETITVPLEGCCPGCGGDLENRRSHEHYVTDIPPVVPVTKKFITESGACEDCNRRWNSSHDELPSHATGAAGVMIGNRAVALAAQMRLEFGAPLRKIAGYLSSALGLPISGAGVLGLLKRASRALEKTCGDLEQQLQEAPKVCADETGWRVASESAWAWVFTNDDTTFYTVNKSRANGVVLGVLGEDFQGVLQSDCFNAYLPLPYKKAKCLAHLLKALKDREAIQSGDDLEFSRIAIELLKDAIALPKSGLDPRLYFAVACPQLEERMDRLLRTDYEGTSNALLAKRMAKFRDEWFVFLYNPDVDPTNNQAERQIRPFVLIRKISAGNRSQWGALVYAQLMSVFSTCRQRGQSFVDIAISALVEPTLPYLSRT